LHDLGPFQAPPRPVERLRDLEFRIPAEPRPEADDPVSVRPDVLGVFLNGQPIYNYFDAASYGGRNLWRYDWIALMTMGEEPSGLGLLHGWIEDSTRHSPMLGFAFDGSPVYGPWGYGKDGQPQRMRSSYRLRAMEARTSWADGTELKAGQAGPSLEEAPLGTFVEDYEYVGGAGDLDRSNGRWAVTPEYPDGVYAYFLSTDDAGALAFPYLVGPVYGRAVRAEELRTAVQDFSAPAKTLFELGEERAAAQSGGLRLSSSVRGRTMRLSFEALDADGDTLRNLEWVHERPLHLLVVSEDLSRFEHIHPELLGGDQYVVEHEFAEAGEYWLYADYTLPGAATRVESFRVSVGDDFVEPVALEAESNEVTVGPLRAGWSADEPLAAGQDLELTFEVRDAASGLRIPDLEPYLGAWGHFVLIREGHGGFIHAHPIEEGSSGAEEANTPHVHGAGAEATGPPPAKIRVAVNFSESGRYKLWAQFQLDGEVHTAAFVLNVAARTETVRETPEIPAGAVAVRIEPGGYSPSRVELEAGTAATLAFVRSAESNCGRRVVFPELDVDVAVEPGGTALVEIPAHAAGELAFSCGMGMYRGALVLTAGD